MPGFTPIPGDIIQVRAVCYTPTQIGMNVLHYKIRDIAGVGLGLDQYATILEQAWAPKYKAWMSVNTSWNGVGIKNLSLPATIEYHSSALDGPGTTAGNMAPGQVSGLAKWRGTNAGRKGIGHSYIPFPAASQIALNGTLTVPGLAALRNVVLELGPTVLIEQGANVITIDLLIRNANVNVPAPGTPAGTLVFTGAAAPILATQRRRGSFGAANVKPFS